MTIRLLVSVRNATEAVEALNGGADIIDVKEPSSGALGFAGSEVVGKVVSAVADRAPVSVALGEIHEWLSPSVPPGAEGISYAKLGPIHSPPDAAILNSPNWFDAWKAGRMNTAINRTSNWVAVAYADYETASVPPPEEILEHAVDAGVGVFLIDTRSKGTQSIFDILSTQRLSTLRTKTLDAGLTFALAGQIREHHLPLVHDVKPDIVGVRGAVCVSNDRSARLSAVKVQSLKNLLCSQTAEVSSCGQA